MVQASTISSRLRDLEESVKEQPVKALGIAAMAGFVVGGGYRSRLGISILGLMGGLVCGTWRFRRSRKQLIAIEMARIGNSTTEARGNRRQILEQIKRRLDAFTALFRGRAPKEWALAKRRKIYKLGEPIGVNRRQDDAKRSRWGAEPSTLFLNFHLCDHHAVDGRRRRRTSHVSPNFLRAPNSD
jgi:hypothetical protein